MVMVMFLVCLQVCLAIAHYSQPADLQLLFAFEYVSKKYHNPGNEAFSCFHN